MSAWFTNENLIVGAVSLVVGAASGYGVCRMTSENFRKEAEEAQKQLDALNDTVNAAKSNNT